MIILSSFLKLDCNDKGPLMGLAMRTFQCSALIFAIHGLTGIAVDRSQIAVAELSNENEILSATKGPRTTSMPVTWEVTRARFDEKGHSSDSESFQETWRLEVTPQGEAILHSPRESVPVDSLTFFKDTVISVNVTESNLARLTGLFVQSNASIAGAQKTFSIQFDENSSAQDVTLNMTDEEHLAIRVAAGTPR